MWAFLNFRINAGFFILVVDAGYDNQWISKKNYLNPQICIKWRLKIDPEIYNDKVLTPSCSSLFLTSIIGPILYSVFVSL